MKKLDKPIDGSKSHAPQDDNYYSLHFNKSYSNSKSSYLQSDFIFIQKNQIKRRLSAAIGNFTIAEIGFGMGLNFLLTLQAYQKLQQDTLTKLVPLHFISVEKYPLSKMQLKASLSMLTQLEYFSSALIESYPDTFNEALAQCHQANFLNGQVRLTLIIDESVQGLSSLKSPKGGLVDAWYLQNMSSNKTPDMLNELLFTHIGRLSKEQATLTTLMVKPFVKQHLVDIGFRIENQVTPDKSKEMFYAVMQSNPVTKKGYQLSPHITKPKHVSIIGGGIASACVAHALTKQGIKVTLYCKDKSLAQGGSSNAMGAIYPLLHQETDDISDFYQQAFWHAKALYTEIASKGFPFDHKWCGLLEISYKEALIKRQELFEKLNTWPKSLIHGVNAQEASKLANIDLPYGGLFMPHAGWVSPQGLVSSIFNVSKATNCLTIITDTHITKIQQVTNNTTTKSNKSWRLYSKQGEFNASVLVVCAGADSIDIEQLKPLPLTPTRGQVTSMASNTHINKLSTVICHKGYLTPENKGTHCIGATFQKNDTNVNTNRVDDHYNLTTLRKCLPELSKKINWQEQDISSSKARLRCMSRDHLPLVGAVPDIKQHIQAYPHLAKDKNWPYNQPAPCIDNLYILLGLGARGLCSAPLAADILAAELCNTPYPMTKQKIFNLSPNRFIVRDIIKRKVLE
jgi:tRNA 5-methylaminomethyl-2-thiouridine biosynthesis bifunctional protein